MNRRIRVFFCSLTAALLVGSAAGASDPFGDEREGMVQTQIQARGISDPLSLAAMAAVPRDRFVPAHLRSMAYADRPLPIGEGQTISQPYIVALMTQSLALDTDDRVLEIGTGSGYQAAVLAAIVKDVYTVEIKPALYAKADGLLRSLNVANVHTRRADGYFGWPEAAPFDGIMITAAVDHVPPPLLKQLKDGGRLILPLGNPFVYQHLVMVTRRGDDFHQQTIAAVQFVPLTGYAMEKKY
jgi:protein-L-isoaspartate(D-aspartate) O-methyltransferase